jgi:hypothetical protein
LTDHVQPVHVPPRTADTLAKTGTPGGGSGGAIYLDRNRFTIRIAGDRTGTMSIEDSTLRDNPSDGFESRGLPGIFFGARNPTITNSTLA